MNTIIVKKENGRFALINKDREKGIYSAEIASGPATEHGLKWLMQVEKAYSEREQTTNAD